MKHFAYVAALFAAASLVIAAGAGASSYPDRPLAPDDRVRHAPSATASVRSAGVAPDDRVIHHPSAISSAQMITPVVQRSTAGDAFDWVDAGIGAAGMAGLALLSLGATLVLRRREQAAFS